MQRATFARVAVVVAYIGAALIFTWPLPLHLSTHFTGDPGGDTGVYVWNQWVFHQELTTGHNPLTTEKILALTPRVDLTQHNYTPFLNLAALPLITPFGVTAAFNLVFLAMCVLNGVMMYGLARRVTKATRMEAWLAGLLFAWSPTVMARTTGHFSLAAVAALPAFVWCLINAERTRSARDAALVGLCMAWAATCDAYFGIYCLLIAAVYVAATVIRFTRVQGATPHPWNWIVDVLLICVGAFVGALVLGYGGQLSVLGLRIGLQSLYTPMLLMTALTIVRGLLLWRPRIQWTFGPMPVKSLLIAFIACVGPLSPVLYGLGTRVSEGRFISSPGIYWRSSPHGVDLLSFVTPNPLHPIARWLLDDPLAMRPTHYVEYTASLSLVAFAIVALAAWRARFRPSAVWIAIAMGFAMLALGPFVHVGGLNTHIPGPWALLRYAPGLSLARMPTRFALVASMGFAVIFAGALAALGAAWPHRRRRIVACAGVLLVCELWATPRPLYSATISPIYDHIAEDPRPVRVLTLPFGVRDGTWETGNFRPRTQYNQTRHGKALVGGYLSRISQRRVDRMRREYPTLDALIRLSEPGPLDPSVAATLRARGDRLVEQAHLGYVVIDQRFVPPERAQLVIDTLKLREVQRDQHLTLYVPQ